MAEPQNPEELLRRILAGEGGETAQEEGAASGSLMRKPESSEVLLADSLRHPEMATWLAHLSQSVPEPQEPELARYFRLALLGVSVAFMERGLSPYLPEHVAIITPLLEDIRGVFERIRASGSRYDPEEFCRRAYEYGIHKATYLDWQLYLSKEMY
ncbi:MAG: hypothetical protein OEW39_05530 [Deltaproteobacteria bacterium]|nr:hypothetical protein [Deltaproteobacteria bacterium]